MGTNGHKCALEGKHALNARLFTAHDGKCVRSDVVESGGGLATHLRVWIIGGASQRGQTCGAACVARGKAVISLNCVDGVNDINAVGLIYVRKGVRQCWNCWRTNLAESVDCPQAHYRLLIVFHQGFELWDCGDRIAVENRESQARVLRP